MGGLDPEEIAKKDSPARPLVNPFIIKDQNFNINPSPAIMAFSS